MAENHELYELSALLQRQAEIFESIADGVTNPFASAAEDVQSSELTPNLLVRLMVLFQARSELNTYTLLTRVQMLAMEVEVIASAEITPLVKELVEILESDRKKMWEAYAETWKDEGLVTINESKDEEPPAPTENS